MTTAPKKRAPKASPQPAIPAEEMLDVDDEEIRPVQLGQRKQSVEMVDVFELDGRMYRIPVKPNTAVLLRYLKESSNKKIGVSVANVNLLLAMLGQDAWDALSDSPDVSDDDVAEVFKIVWRVVEEALQKLTPPGN